MHFTYYTIIGKNLKLFQSHVQNIKIYSGFDSMPCDKEFLIIIYKNSSIPESTTQSILDFCKEENIRPVIYDEPDSNFLNNLYFSWNLGYQESKEGYVFRSGSDQVFSKDSFLYLYEAAEKLRTTGYEKFILQANTIENLTALNKIGATSRHFAIDLGGTFEEFDYKTFEDLIASFEKKIPKEIDLIDIETALKYWKKPTKLQTTLGIIDRVDGCSWLQMKSDWEKHGALVPINAQGITGDVTYIDELQRQNYKMYIPRNVHTYHFVRGESFNQY